ncbi:hypothetical protein [Streptomyces asiaticus]
MRAGQAPPAFSLRASDSRSQGLSTPGYATTKKIDALRLVAAARQAVDDDIRGWEQLSRTTDFPGGAQITGA